MRSTPEEDPGPPRTRPATSKEGTAEIEEPAASLKPRRPFAGFEVERSAYAVARPVLLVSAAGRFVAFVGEEMVGVFDVHRDAYLAARRRFGPGPMYIKQVVAEEPIFEPIAIEPCPS